MGNSKYQMKLHADDGRKVGIFIMGESLVQALSSLIITVAEPDLNSHGAKS